MKLKFLRLLYYHQYVMQEKVGNADIAPLTVVAYMGFVAALDLMLLLSLITLFTPIEIKLWNGAITVLISIVIFYFLLEFKYDYKRMVRLSKVIVGKKGKCIWIISMYVITILLPLVVCTLWWANNNGYLNIRG